jgi:hypothetical protein
MSYFISSADNCVFLTYEGNFSSEGVATAWREIQGLLIATGWKRVLLDITAMQASPEKEELFDWAKLFLRDFPQSGRVAVLIRWDQSQFAKLLEMLVRSVGIYLTVFVSEGQAEAWLIGESREKYRRRRLDSSAKTCPAANKPRGVNLMS